MLGIARVRCSVSKRGLEVRERAEPMAAVTDCIAVLEQHIDRLRGSPEVPTNVIDELAAILADIRANLACKQAGVNP